MGDHMNGEVGERYFENVYNVLKGMAVKYADKENTLNEPIIRDMETKVIDGYTIIRAPDYIRHINDDYWYIITELDVMFISALRNTKDAYEQLTAGIQGQAFVMVTIQ